MIKNKKEQKIFSKICNFEEVIKYINSNSDKKFDNVYTRINDYLLKLVSKFGENVSDLKLTSLHRLSYTKLDYVFYNIKTGIYYNFFSFDQNQVDFDSDKQLLLRYENEYGYNFQIQDNKPLKEFSDEELRDLKIAFLNKYKDSKFIIDFELFDKDIFKIKEVKFEDVTMENYDNDKFLDFIEEFYKVQKENNEPYFWLPDDIVGAIGIKEDGSYFIYDLNRISWYPCDNLNYYYLTRILPENTIFHTDIVLSEEADIKFMKEIHSRFDDLKIVKKYRLSRKIEKILEL